jgi:pimeloyl-ACP methyl ester carboxylesterase
VTYLEDLERHRYNDALEDALATCRTPVAIITGTEDLVAPQADAKQLASKLQHCDHREHIIPATGHTFGTEHPAAHRSLALEEALERTSAFFNAVCTAS